MASGAVLVLTHVYGGDPLVSDPFRDGKGVGCEVDGYVHYRVIDSLSWTGGSACPARSLVLCFLRCFQLEDVLVKLAVVYCGVFEGRFWA